METFFVKNIRELKRELKFLEKELNVKIKVSGNSVTTQGDPLDEYEAGLVFNAINFGFSARTAALLKNEDFVLTIINIKDHTRRKNLSEVKARLIGTHGQTKNTLEEISGCKLIIKDKEVGILGDAEEMEYASTAVCNIIKGSKQSNVYKYLEKINKKEKVKGTGKKPKNKIKR